MHEVEKGGRQKVGRQRRRRQREGDGLIRDRVGGSCQASEARPRLVLNWEGGREWKREG